MKTDMRPVTLNLPGELIHAVDSAARADLRSRSNYVRAVLEAALAAGAAASLGRSPRTPTPGNGVGASLLPVWAPRELAEQGR
jgi:hypothetical protein